ncbi:hypothetical protein CL645_04270 [bacterium]|nr:hypothetical protein [bacterium]|tara:strand:+ start:1217 stop:1672 length:456 start_codon:yes stop_codon:yes gene_type:complete
MSEKEYFKSINNLIRKSDIKIKQKEKNIAKKIIQRWNKIWPFVGREIELKTTKNGVFLYLLVDYEGQFFRVASLSFRIDRKNLFFIQAPVPERSAWTNQKFARILDFLFQEWSALEFATGLGKTSIIIPLNDLDNNSDVDFIIEDLLEVVK